MKLRLSGVLLCASLGSATAHPHVFIDGSVDFVFSEETKLQGIEVTWLYDPFETLFVLSSLDIDPGDSWQLTDAQRERIVAYESDWSDTFNGAARLAQNGEPLALDPPSDFDVRLVGNQLEVRFERALSQPVTVQQDAVGVTFFEETYFYAFSLVKSPQLLGPENSCTAVVDRFDPDTQMAELQATLAQLGREETPEDTDIGRLFTDKIHLTCD